MRFRHLGLTKWNSSATRVQSIATLLEQWESLLWEKIMDRLKTETHLTANILESTFRELSCCRFRPPPEAMHRDLNRLAHLCTSRKAVHMWSPHRMMLVFSSCSMLGYVNPFFFGEMWKCMRAKEFVSQLDTAELTTLIKSMGLLGRTASRTNSMQPCGVFFGVSEMLLEAMEALMQQERLLACTETQIVEIWKGLGRLRFYDVAYLRHLAKETIKQNRIQSYNETSMANIVLSTALVKYTHRHFVTVLLDACTVQHRLKAYNEENLVLLYQGLCLLSIKDEPCLTALDDEVCKSHRRTALEVRHIATLIAAAGLLNWYNLPFMECMAQEVRHSRRRRLFLEAQLEDIPAAFAKCYDGCEEQELRDAIAKCARAHKSLIYSPDF